MLKWLVAIILVLAVLSVAGCCCCSSGYDGYSGYYSTVSQDEAASSCTCDTPYDCPAGGCTCPCQK
jgi:hypothetical protein